MKKLLLFVCAAGLSLISIAQTADKTYTKGEEVKYDYYSQKAQKTDVTEWYNYGDEQRQLAGRLFTWTPIHPSSEVAFEYSTGYGNINWNAMGQVFDPKGPLWYTKPIKLDSNDLYTVDSIEVPFRYTRFQTSFPDTLRIQVYNHSALQPYTFTSSGINFLTLDYDYMTNTGIGADNAQEILLPLTDSDTSSGFITRTFPVNLTPGRGECVALTVDFIPGNPYSPSDTLFSSSDPIGNPLNRVDVLVDADPSQTHANGYFNTGLFIDSTNRNNTGGWAGIYIPGLAYVSDYINSAFGFHVDATDVGIENSVISGFEVKQNYPNPFENTTVIEYSITFPAMVNLEVFDITGKSVMTINEGFKNTGNYRVELDASNLKSGVYYYTFRTESGQITKKMMIQK